MSRSHDVVVVGSGPSGVHFAWTLLEAGRAVTMVDVGRRGSPLPLPEASLPRLKEELDDPVSYFLGDAFEAALLPGSGGEYYGFPPGKSHVFEPAPGFGVESRGFAPLTSFARGGLAEAWTGGCYPLNDREMASFPFGWAELGPRYGEVARRIGVSGAEDDLAELLPLHEHLQPPVALDDHSRRLLATYEDRRSRLRSIGCRVGRSRLAVLSRDHDGRVACARLGRCLWGCPSRSLYTPSVTLERCLERPEFRYLPGLEALSFRLSGGRAEALRVRPLAGGADEEIPVDRLVLAAGTLSSSLLLLRSLAGEGDRRQLAGLMDNRQIFVPFVNLRQLGRPWSAESYQYHQLGMALDGGSPSEAVHGQITTLTTALVHPFAQRLPFDLGTAVRVTANVHAALGLLNLNLADERRDTCRVGLADGTEAAGVERLAVRYEPPVGEGARLRWVVRRARRALRRLGCWVPPGMVHIRPMGASVHYAGTLPMTVDGGPGTTTPGCRSRDVENLWLVDGSVFPALPAKNLTFTLMANAVRVAEEEFG